MPALSRFLFEGGEDHAASGSLQNAGYRGLHLLAKMPAGILHHHHGAVIQIGHTLSLAPCPLS